MGNFKNKYILFFLAVSSLPQAGIFTTYNQEGVIFRDSLNSSLSDSLITKFDKNLSSNDAILYHLEKARILQVNQQVDESSKLYKKAFELLNKQNNQAIVSASRLGFKVLSMFSNDSVVPYKVPAYEQVLAHVFQAKNYIYLNDIDAACVEMRIAQGIQREIEIKNEKEFEKKSENIKVEQRQSEQKMIENLDEVFSEIVPITGQFKNTYQNAYAFYMAANLWEALGQYNDALVDYKKAYELNADLNILKDIERLNNMNNKNMDTVSIIVFIEQGVVPEKVENILAIPFENSLVPIAFTTYEPSTYQRPYRLNIYLGDLRTQQSFILNDIGALAVKELKEQTMSTISKHIVRAATKYEVQKLLGNNLGSSGELLGNIINIATERADLRAWSTLPSNTQIARFEVKPGSHILKFVGHELVSSNIQVNANMNQTIFIYVSDINNKISTSVSTITHDFK